MPPAATKSNMAKISKSYILTPPRPQGHGMSVKCEEPIDELTVQVWLLHLHPNFKYCTLLVSGTELRTDRRTDRQTDGQTDGQTDDPITRCPRRTFQDGGIKINALWPWPRLMGSLCMKFHDYRCKGKAIMQQLNISHFQLSMHCELDLLTPKPIGHILNSRGVFVWSFMIIGVKGKQLCNINHFQLSMHCDLDHMTLKSIRHILSSLRIVV